MPLQASGRSYPPVRYKSNPAFELATTALPAAGASATSTGLDTVFFHKDRYMELADLRINVPATPNLANGQTLTLQLVDSDDNATWVAMASEAPDVITGAGGVGGPVSEFTHVLNSRCYALRNIPITRRYVALQVTASATAGNNTAVSSSLQFFS